MYSFSQNFEDVYIRRAFAGITDGFYIDAGAYDPVVDSVTKMLYDLGWSGINVEPGPSFPSFAERTRDINLSVALGRTEGTTTFHYNPRDPGTSTTSPSNMPKAPEAADVQSYEVPVQTLAGIVEAHAKGRHVHFVKLDIEGAEWDVLESTDWSSFRPELIIVESTRPYTNERRDAGWAEHMARFAYDEVFFDGVNTYFLREESASRRDAFSRPVNVLDGVRKFDPVQHGVVAAPSLVHDIREALDRAQDVLVQENRATRERIEESRAADLQAAEQRGRAAAEQELSPELGKLTADLQATRAALSAQEAAQEAHLAGLRTIAEAVARQAGLGEGTSRGNSPEALLSDLDRLLDEWGNAQQEAAARARAEEHVLRQQIALLDADAKRGHAEAEQLKERLAGARRSRSRVIELANDLSARELARQAKAFEQRVQRIERDHKATVAELEARLDAQRTDAEQRIKRLDQILADNLHAVQDSERRHRATEEALIRQVDRIEQRELRITRDRSAALARAEQLESQLQAERANAEQRLTELLADNDRALSDAERMWVEANQAKSQAERADAEQQIARLQEEGADKARARDEAERRWLDAQEALICRADRYQQRALRIERERDIAAARVRQLEEALRARQVPTDQQATHSQDDDAGNEGAPHDAELERVNAMLWSELSSSEEARLQTASHATNGRAGWKARLKLRSHRTIRVADRLRDGGRHAEAASAYAKAYALFPERPDLCVQMANMLKDSGDYAAAEQAYREAIGRLPADPDVSLQLGRLYEVWGLPDRARLAYRRSVLLSSDDSPAALALRNIDAEHLRSERGG